MYKISLLIKYLINGVLAPVYEGRPPEKLVPPHLLTHKVLSNQFSHKKFEIQNLGNRISCNLSEYFIQIDTRNPNAALTENTLNYHKNNIVYISPRNAACPHNVIYMH